MKYYKQSMLDFMIWLKTLSLPEMTAEAKLSVPGADNPDDPYMITSFNGAYHALTDNQIKFLSQGLESWMIRPEDEDGNEVERPLNYDHWEQGTYVASGLDFGLMECYKEAKERMIFKDVYSGGYLVARADVHYSIKGLGQIMTIKKGGTTILYDYKTVNDIITAK